jgi:hypothetical protein
VGRAELETKRKTRGLSAIAQAREDRAGGRTRWTTTAGFVALAAVLGGYLVHMVVSERQRSADRGALLAKQRAVAMTLGTEWQPLRDKLEADVMGAAKEYEGDLVDPAARKGDFKTQPGLYLRMRVADAKDAASIRKVAADAKKDAFASCLLREPNERGARGEVDGGAFADQPWNLGQAYSATRILTEEWVAGLKEADDDMALRLMTHQYEAAISKEIPLAIDVVKRAQFFLLVLDEDVAEAKVAGDGGAIDELALQSVAHPARVHLFDLPTGKELLRLRRSGSAQVIPAGERAVADSETQAAVQRQANNCALARRVEEAISPQATASAPRSGDGGMR